MAQALTLSLRSYDAQPLSHRHDFHQIVLPVDGMLEMEVDGKGGRVGGYQAALVAANRMHSCEAAGPNRFVVLDWTASDAMGEEGPARLSDFAERHPFLAYDSGMQHLIAFLGTELSRQRGTASDSRLWGAVLLAALTDRVGMGGMAAPRQINRAIAYIRAHHRRPLAVPEIARAACCSDSHLHALFQRHLGASPMDYVAEVRLDSAIALLADSTDAISAIALETGHADQSVLTRSMKRRRGITPAAYRRQIRSGRA